MRVPNTDFANTVDTGSSVMAPATLAGRTPLDAMREAETIEQGLLFVNGSGNLIFKDRRTLDNIRVQDWPMAHDPVRAEASVRELAAVTDDQMIEGIRAGIAAVVAAWAADPAYARRDTNTRERDALIALVAARLAALPDDADLRAVVELATRLLNPWFPDSTPHERAVSEAVDRLRCAAIIWPGLVRDVRGIGRRD